MLQGYQIAFADLDIHPPITKTHERIYACRTQTRYYFPQMILILVIGANKKRVPHLNTQKTKDKAIKSFLT